MVINQFLNVTTGNEKTFLRIYTWEKHSSPSAFNFSVIIWAFNPAAKALEKGLTIYFGAAWINQLFGA